MADKLTELKAALKRMPNKRLRLIEEFVEFLAKTKQPSSKE